jgi:hypothetical protein
MFPCCDVCIRSKGSEFLTDAESSILTLIDRIQSRVRPGADREIIDVDNIDAGSSKTKLPGARRDDRLRLCEDAATRWRNTTWQEKYSKCAWGPKVLLPDAVIKKLARRTHLSTVEDIKREIPEWDFVDGHGGDVLAAIQKVDNVWQDEHEQEKATKREKRKRASIDKKEKRDEEQRQKRAKESAQRRIEKAQPQLYPFVPIAMSLPSPSFPPAPGLLQHVYQPAYPASQQLPYYSIPMQYHYQFPSSVS